jgi:hypothetical protein
MLQDQIATTSLLSLFDTTKQERQSFCIDVISRLEAGQSDPLKVHLQVKSMEDMIKQLTDNKVYKTLVLEAAEKFGGKSFKFGNADIQVKEVGTKYDYTQVNDPKYFALKVIADEANKALKEREEFLKSVPSEGLQVVDENGELNTVYRPSKTSTTSVAVTLK